MERRATNPLSEVGQEVQKIANQLSGSIGIAIKALESEDSYYNNEHMLCPAASTIKIHILVELFNQVRAGELKLEDPIEIPMVDRVGALWSPTSSGVLKDLDSVNLISLKDAATLMIIVSDNVATNLLIDLLGIDRIQKTIRTLGLRNTKLQRKMMDLESAATGVDNISTPYEIMVTLQKIAKAEILDPNRCSALLDILAKSQDVLGLRRLLPEGIRIEHKTGELTDVCNDVGIVRVPGNPFIISVMTKGVNLVQGWDTIAAIGRMFYDRFSSKR